MRVNVSIDTDKVAAAVEGTGTFVEPVVKGVYFVDGYMQHVVDAVIKNLEFSFDRDDAELGQVIQFPGSMNA